MSFFTRKLIQLAGEEPSAIEATVKPKLCAG